MKMIILAGFATLLLAGCTDDEAQFVFDNRIEFYLTSPTGEDLLDPESPNSLDTSKIKLFYLVDDEIQEVYDPLMDYPRNFFVYQPQDNYRMRVFLNTSDREEFPVTYIQWNETDTDTIKAEYRRTRSSVTIRKIWINGKYQWASTDKAPKYFHLIK